MHFEYNPNVGPQDNSGAVSDFSLAPSDQNVSDAQLTALQNYYGTTDQQTAYQDYTQDVSTGSAPTSQDLGGVAPPSGNTTSAFISQMTPDQTAAMGVDMSGNPLSSSSANLSDTGAPSDMSAGTP
jgi:uncharacterized protein (DUF305 family)